MILLKSIIDKTLAKEIENKNESLYEIIKKNELNDFELLIFNGEEQIKDFNYIPKNKDFIEIYLKPAGGSTGRNILASFAGIAFAGAFAPALTGIFGSSFLGVAASTVTKSYIAQQFTNGFIKTSKPVKSEFKQDPRNYTLTNQSNEIRKYNVIPDVYGKVRMFPPLAAQPYTEISGNEQFLRMLFTCGFGRVDISDIKIGDTAITAFNNYEIEILEGYSGDPDLTIYNNDIFQENINVELVYTTPTQTWVEKSTQLNTDEAIVDFSFPNGLFKIDNTDAKQRKQLENSNIEISYRLTGSGTWLNPELIIVEKSEGINVAVTGDPNVGAISINDKNTSNIFKYIKFKFPTNGQYDIRFSKVSEDIESGYTVRNQTYLDNIKSISYSNPINKDNISLIALRIKATDQLNGTLERLNCIVQRYVPVYDGVSTWTETISRNPTWAYVNILRGIGNEKPITEDARYDLDQIKILESFCNTNSFNFDFIFDGRTTVNDALDTVLASCRSEKTLIDGKYSVVIDKENTTVSQVLTPKNIISFQANKNFSEELHALRCYFINEDEAYEQDERIVYNDGYDEITATNIQDYRIPGVVNKDQIWKLARYLLATQKLRPYIYLYKMDIENLIIEKGSVVEAQHDVLKVGISNDRIKVVNKSGNDILTIEFAENCPMVTGTNYAVRIRKNNGQSQVFPVNTVDGDNQILTFTTPIDSTIFDINKGDLFAFGEVDKITRSLLVKSIKFNGDFIADVECVDYNDLIYQADQGVIPAFVSNITETYEERNEIPEKPVIARIASDSFVLGINTNNKFQTRILIDLKPASRLSVIAQFYECRYRKTNDTSEWTWISDIKSDAAKVIIDNVDNGIDYDIQLRSKYKNNVSDWTETLSYTVTGKNIPPDDVTGLSSDFSTQNLILSWTHVKELETDLDYYEIRRSLTDVGFDSATYFAETRKNTITIDMLEKYGTSGKDAYYYYIKARDEAGNYSTNQTAFGQIQNNSPNMPSVTLDFNGKDAKFSWVHNETDDFQKYVFEIYNTSNVLQTSYTINNSEFIFKFEENKQLFVSAQRNFKYKVIKYDVFNQTDETSLLTASNALPIAPTGVTLTPRLGGFSASWNSNSEPDIVSYRVYFSTSATPALYNDVGNTKEFTVSVDTYDTYYLRVVAVDSFGSGFFSSTVSGIAKKLETKDYNLDTFLTEGIDFSVNLSNQAEWTAGTLSHKGTVYNIIAGTTTDKYIYFDPNISTTIFQTSSTKPAVGINVGLMAVFDSTQLKVFPAQNNRIQHAGLLQADTITAEEILAKTITANEIQAQTITTNELSADVLFANNIKVGDLTNNYGLEEGINPFSIVDSDLKDRWDAKNLSLQTAKQNIKPEGISTVTKYDSGLISNGSDLIASLDYIDKGITVEKGTTNIFDNDRDIFNNWTESGVSLSDSGEVLKGNKISIIKVTGVGASLNTNTTVTNGQPYSFSFDVKGKDSSIGKSIEINGDSSSQTIILTSSWKRVEIFHTMTDTSLINQIRPNQGTGNLSIDDEFYIANAQLENSKYATSYTNYGDVRPAGSLKFSTNILSKNEGSILLKLKPKFNYNVDNLLRLIDTRKTGGITGNYLVLSYNNSQDKFNYLVFESGVGSVNINSQQFDDGTSFENIKNGINLLISYKTGEFKMYCNGILNGSDTDSINMTNIFNDIINIGSAYTNVSQIDSTLKEIIFFNKVLTDDEAIKLTSLVDFDMTDNSQQTHGSTSLNGNGIIIEDINSKHIIVNEGTEIYNEAGDLAYKSGLKASLEITGRVNNGAGYPAGDYSSTGITVDAFTTALNTGDLFFFGNQTTIYTVVEGSTTTNLKFTPNLAYALNDNEEILSFNDNGLSIFNGSINLINSDNNVKLVIDPSNFIYIRQQDGSDKSLFFLNPNSGSSIARMGLEGLGGFALTLNNNSTQETLLVDNESSIGDAIRVQRGIVQIDSLPLNDNALKLGTAIEFENGSSRPEYRQINSSMINTTDKTTALSTIGNHQEALYIDSTTGKHTKIYKDGGGVGHYWTEYDGTLGANGTITLASTTSITVVDGIITGWA